MSESRPPSPSDPTPGHEPWTSPGGSQLPPSPPTAPGWAAAPPPPPPQQAPQQPPYRPYQPGVFGSGGYQGSGYQGAGYQGSYGPSGFGSNPYGQPGYGYQAQTAAAPTRTRNHRRHNQLAFLAGLAVASLLIATGVLVRNGLHSTLNSGAQSPVTSPSSGSNNPFSGNGSGNNNPFSGNGSTNDPGGSGSTGSGASSSSTQQIAAKVDAGVVDIDTTLGYQQARAAGTGMVLSSNGLILTNNHVIDGATTITATVVTTGHTYKATVVGTDVTEDVAVLQLQGASGLHTVELGDSSSVGVGDAVVAIGNAGGTGGTPSVVTGSITALGQSITASDENGTNSEQLTGLLQTSAPIVAGDSGGPLVNTDGQVIGIDTAASAENQFASENSTGFAIPINKALSIVHEIQAGHETSNIHIGANGFLGVEFEPASVSGTDAAVVHGVVSGSPADQAGITAGDTITGFDGQAVSSASGLGDLTHHHHPGDKVSVTWTDTSGNSHTATVTLTQGPAA
jgi:S1-C subfamily serine protease